jgi:hypothetical protein
MQLMKGSFVDDQSPKLKTSSEYSLCSFIKSLQIFASFRLQNDDKLLLWLVAFNLLDEHGKPYRDCHET